MYDLWAMAETQRWSANRVRDELDYARGHTSATADEAMFLFAREALLAHPVAFGVNTLWQWGLQLGEPKSGVRTCASAVGPYLCSGRTEGESLPAFPNEPAAPSQLRRWVVAYVSRGSVPMLAVTASAWLGLAAYLRSRRRNIVGALLAVTVGYMTLVPALSQFPQDRFRLPVDALLFMFAAWGVRAIAVRWPAATAERPVAET